MKWVLKSSILSSFIIKSRADVILYQWLKKRRRRPTSATICEYLYLTLTWLINLPLGESVSGQNQTYNYCKSHSHVQRKHSWNSSSFDFLKEENLNIKCKRFKGEKNALSSNDSFLEDVFVNVPNILPSNVN